MLTSDLRPKIFRLLKRIPAGRITTYGEMARAAGCKSQARLVGRILGQNRRLDAYPCYRVIHCDGRVGGYAGGQAEKMSRLRKDGILIRNKRVRSFGQVFYKFK